MNRGVLLQAAEGFGVDGAVPFHHVDAAGIVFYARVFDWFHDVYVAFLSHAGFPLADAIRDAPWLAPLVHADADYVAPLRFGDPLRIAIVGAETSEHRVTLGFRVTSRGTVAVLGCTVHVFVDRAGFRPTPMPPALRAAFDRLGAAGA